MKVLYPVKSTVTANGRQQVSKPLPVTSPWGPRNGGFHQGIDIGCPVNSELQAPETGTFYYNFNTQGGYQVFVLSSDGKRRYGFSHLINHEIASKIGQNQQVQAGTVIGIQGTTGNSRGPHCHFSYNAVIGGKFVNIDPFSGRYRDVTTTSGYATDVTKKLDFRYVPGSIPSTPDQPTGEPMVTTPFPNFVLPPSLIFLIILVLVAYLILRNRKTDTIDLLSGESERTLSLT